MPDYSDNYYARLSIPFDATRDEVRSAYHDAARRLHPDANPAAGAVEQFLRIQEAYETLSDPQKRKDYDQSLPKIDTSPGISMEILYSRRELIQSPDPQLLYVMMELIPVATDQEVVIPLNLCIVIDRSTSMQGERMDVVKATAKNLLKQLRPVDYLSVVAYSDRADVIVPAMRISAGIERVESQISMLQTGGGTEIFRGLEAGFEEISRYLRPNFVNHMILITDGRTYGDEAQCLNLAEKAREAGVTISGLGIGNEWNDKFLDTLTSKTGGSSTYVADPRDIKRFMELKFNRLNRIFAENTTLNLKLSPHVEVHYAFRLSPEPAKFPVEMPINFGNIQNDAGFIVVFEVFVKKVPPQALTVLMEGALRYEIPSRIVPSVRIPITISRPVEKAEVSQQPPPQKIVQAMSRLTLYRMQEQAKQDIEAGNIEQATRRLRFLATHLLAQGETSLATTVLGEAGRIERERSLSGEGEKKIKYGTRALLLPSGNGDNFK
ncbi:MAG: VWA domain-containing protein [Anaerolineales bacterium]|nr:VWA domain-containing protein [Anaerolineales bacterium]